MDIVIDKREEVLTPLMQSIDRINKQPEQTVLPALISESTLLSLSSLLCPKNLRHAQVRCFFIEIINISMFLHWLYE